MPGLFNIGISGLSAAQRQLATTSHNIVNVNTDGYSRQRVDLDTRNPQERTNGFDGKGVQVTSVRRLADQFLISQVRTGLTNQQRAETFHGFAAQLNNLFGDVDSGLSSALQDFFDGIQAVADDPASIPARQVMLSESQTLVDRYHDMANRIDELNSSINGRLQVLVDDVNSLSRQIADLNGDIVLALGRTQGQPPNDLLDTRDQLVAELSEIVGVQTFEQADGALNVIVGNGQSLVVGSTALSLGLTNSPLDPLRKEITYAVGGAQAIISDSLTGGRIEGTVSFRSAVLDPARNALGRLGAAMAQSFNIQHRNGMDLNAALGTDYFSIPAPRVVADPANSGTITVSLDENDIGGLMASDYQLSHDGVNFNLRRLSDGVTQVLAGPGPFDVDGLTITVGAAPAAGDTYFLQPMRDVAAHIDLLVTQPEVIAAAAPIRTAASLGNVSDAQISSGVVLDVTDPNLLNTVTIDFNTPPTTYQINGAGPLLPYTSGADIEVNGWRVQISGAPAAGDQFVVRSNAGGVSDNRNAFALSDLRFTDILDNGTATYQDSYARITADVGAQTRQSEISNSALTVLLHQATAARDAVSGVNLDEEAANLLQFQQAYQASAQVVLAANTVFDALLEAVRR
jgi:flagellar hook-associated protein 1 FlgK